MVPNAVILQWYYQIGTISPCVFSYFFIFNGSLRPKIPKQSKKFHILQKRPNDFD